MKEKIKAIIPVRAGSIRVKNKNIKPFAGKNLLILKIEQLLRIKEIDEVCVNSESEEMLELAKKSGATPVKRLDKFSTNECSINDVWEHMADNIDCEHVIYTNVTNPLVKDDTYKKCIEKYFSLPPGMSLNTVTLVKEFLWMNKTPVNYDPNNQPRSQDLPDVFHPNFAINIIKRDIMKKNKSIISRDFSPFYLDKIESVDIDDEHDFLIAELLYKETVLK
jgi:N-acylneuraminate cytidylyltransferase